MDAEARRATADRAAGNVPPAAPQPLRSLSPETLRLYASDWAAFVTWCRLAGAVTLPAAPPQSQPTSRHSASDSARAHWPGVPPPLPPSIASTGWPRPHPTRRRRRCCGTLAAPPHVGWHRRRRWPDSPAWRPLSRRSRWSARSGSAAAGCRRARPCRAGQPRRRTGPLRGSWHRPRPPQSTGRRTHRHRPARRVPRRLSGACAEGLDGSDR
jgi:hypothetical protein